MDDTTKGLVGGLALAGVAALVSDKNRTAPRAAAFMLGGYLVGRYPVVWQLPVGLAESLYNTTKERLGR